MHYQSEYHPMRYGNQLKHLIDSSLDKYANSSEEGRNNLRGLLLDGIFESEIESLFKDKNIPYEISKNQWAQYKGELFGTYISYLMAGENIFHIQIDLLKMLSKTSVSEVDITSLKLPFSDFYLYFGDDNFFQLSNDSFIDGAYINLLHNGIESSLFIYLTQYTSSFDYKNPNREAVPFLLNDDHLYYLFSADKEEKIGDLIDNSIEDINNEFNLLGEKWKGNISEVTNLIINALCFLSSHHNDSNKRYPSNAPLTFVKKLENARTQKKKNIALEKNRKQGFIRVNFLGDSVKQENPSNPSLTETKGHISPHWRRGHWRNQAIGKDRREHNLIWIKPTLVNREHGHPNIKHIYDTGKTG